jgi:mannosyl-3-phosphoglycerate phosphatase
MPSTVIFTDLDGTLLDNATYSFAAAQEALTELRTHAIPLIVVSSKTRAEIEPIRDRLQNDHPFIVENGGAVVIPTDYFPFPLTGTVLRAGYRVAEMGTPYPFLRTALAEIAKELRAELRGYGEMTVDEIIMRTGLSRQEAELSQQREYDEPFLAERPGVSEDGLAKAIAARGLRYSKGGRFSHLTGPHDKGRAVRYLIDCYARLADCDRDGLGSVAIGDSMNDLPMLEAVEHPILVQRADGSYEPGIEIPRLIRAPGPGPIGWNRALLSLLHRS